MVPDEILRKRDDELAVVFCQVHWCDDQQHHVENSSGVSPGGDLNPFGWFVIGTTGGGNGVVVHADEPGVYFADHEWDAEKKRGRCAAGTNLIGTVDCRVPEIFG